MTLDVNKYANLWGLENYDWNIPCYFQYFHIAFHIKTHTITTNYMSEFSKQSRR